MATVGLRIYTSGSSGSPKGVMIRQVGAELIDGDGAGDHKDYGAQLRV